MSAARLAAGIGALLLVAALGEGGASPAGLLAVHAGVAGLLALGLVLPRDPSRDLAPAPLPFAAFAGFAVLAALSAAVAPYRFAAYLVMQEIAAFAAVALLASRCGPDLLSRLPWPMLAGASAEGILALAQRLGGEARPAGTFLNPNHLAAWLVASILIAAGGARPGGGRGTVRWRALLAAPAAAALVATGSRGALAALVAGGTTLLLLSWRTLGPRARRLALATSGLIVLAVGVGVASRFERGDVFRYQRTRIWKASLEAALGAPWTGTGPGQFATAALNLNFPISEGPLRFSRSFRSTHSDLIRLPAEFGVPAALAALAAVLLAARQIARRVRAGALAPGSAGAVAALVALGAGALVDNPSERPALHLLAAAILGGLLSDAPRRAARPGPVLRSTCLAALAVLFLVGDVAPYLAWRATQGLPRGRLDAAGKERLEDATRLNPIQPDLRLRRAESLLASPEFGPAAYAEAREAAERAARLAPLDPGYRTGIARVEALACLRLFRDEATRARAAARYDEAIERSRHDPFLPIEKAGFLLDAGDAVGARRAAEMALRIEPEAVPARLLLAEAALAEGSPGSADRAARLLAEAEESAKRWSAWPRQSPYEAQLLALDPARLRAIRSRLGRPSS